MNEQTLRILKAKLLSNMFKYGIVYGKPDIVGNDGRQDSVYIPCSNKEEVDIIYNMLINEKFTRVTRHAIVKAEFLECAGCGDYSVFMKFDTRSECHEFIQKILK